MQRLVSGLTRATALVSGLARAMAFIGGTVLVALILLVCVSVAGRVANGLLHSGPVEALAPGAAKWLLGLGIGPVNGDFEIVEAGIAFAIFAFLPLAQITSAHATVDIFALRLGPRMNRLLILAGEVLFAAALVIIARQLEAGMQSKIRSHQTSFLLQFPVWWSYAASFAAAAIAALVAVFTALMRLVETLSGQPILPAGEGAEG